jgi:uncharacterized protein (DUF1697 family)
MPALRDALADAGFDDVKTYLQSGNVVLTSKASAATVRTKTKKAIKDAFGLDIDVVTRSRADLKRVVDKNPLAKVAKNPKRYQVTFVEGKLAPAVVKQMKQAVVKPEQVVVSGREVYAWHPDTIARSKLWAFLAGPKLGVPATARNWTTVTKLLELADE